MRKGEVRRAGATVWRERIARQARSGLSVGEFCRRAGVSAWSFYRWRLRLRARSGAVQRPAKGGEVVPREPVTAEPEGAFIDLGALPSASSSFQVRLELGGGVVLHLVRR
jgi:putative transposase